MEKLFVYGTLRDRVVRQQLLGREVECTEAQLSGYRKTEIEIENEIYPILVSDPESVVSGVLITITKGELAALDGYETTAYQRKRVTLNSGQHAWVYLIPGSNEKPHLS